MTPVNVKLEDREVEGLDLAISQGLATNRSDAIRIALKRQLRDWERKRLDAAWARVLPGDDDEFKEMNSAAKTGWSDLDTDSPLGDTPKFPRRSNDPPLGDTPKFPRRTHDS